MKENKCLAVPLSSSYELRHTPGETYSGWDGDYTIGMLPDPKTGKQNKDWMTLAMYPVDGGAVFCAFKDYQMARDYALEHDMPVFSLEGLFGTEDVAKVDE